MPLIANYSLSRKAPYHYGWDWGPRIVTCGIWKDVYLEMYFGAKIDSVVVRTKNIQENEAIIEATVEIIPLSLYGLYELRIENLNTSSTYS